MSERVASGEVYTVPIGLAVHCVRCQAKLEPGAKCYIEDDSSSIYCPKCAPVKPAESSTGEVSERRSVPKRKMHKMHADWMMYD